MNWPLNFVSSKWVVCQAINIEPVVNYFIKLKCQINEPAFEFRKFIFCPFGFMTVQFHVRSALCPFGILGLASCLSAKVHSASCPSTLKVPNNSNMSRVLQVTSWFLKFSSYLHSQDMMSYALPKEVTKNKFSMVSRANYEHSVL